MPAVTIPGVRRELPWTERLQERAKQSGRHVRAFTRTASFLSSGPIHV